MLLQVARDELHALDVETVHDELARRRLQVLVSAIVELAQRMRAELDAKRCAFKSDRCPHCGWSVPGWKTSACPRCGRERGDGRAPERSGSRSPL